ncbi:hypothetical protein J6590_017765 [Homalodisca vitripennis]|nr:hypothetical protein J6590_017765 [Homalodisca vitripennis]
MYYRMWCNVGGGGNPPREGVREGGSNSTPQIEVMLATTFAFSVVLQNPFTKTIFPYLHRENSWEWKRFKLSTSSDTRYKFRVPQTVLSEEAIRERYQFPAKSESLPDDTYRQTDRKLTTSLRLVAAKSHRYVATKDVSYMSSLVAR